MIAYRCILGEGAAGEEHPGAKKARLGEDEQVPASEAAVQQ